MTKETRTHLEAIADTLIGLMRIGFEGRHLPHSTVRLAMVEAYELGEKAGRSEKNPSLSTTCSPK